MRKATTLLSVAAAALLLTSAGNVSAGNPVRRSFVAHAAKTRVVLAGTHPATVTSKAAKAAGAKADGKTESILVDEDFNAFTEGTIEKPDTTKMLASEYSGYSDNGIFIDASKTKDGQWFGSQVYSAGGALALKTYNPQQQAYLCTPLGDYSGDITVTCKVKAIKAVYRTENEDGSIGYITSSGSSLGIQPCYGGYEGIDVANTDDPGNMYDTRLYEKDGWQKVTYTFKNYSANSDGYICFFTEGAVVIDDVEITAGYSFIASPAIKGITDFQKDNFTIEWEPVRHAYNYYVDLFTRHYLSDRDTTWNEDFEGSALADGFSSTSTQYSDTAGVERSRALLLQNGDTLVFPTNGNDYKSLHFFLHAIDPTVDTNEDYWQWYVEGELIIDLKNEDGWKNIGFYYLSGFAEHGDTIKLEEEYNKFKAGGFTQLRLRAEGLNDGAFVAIDNANVTAGPSFEYKLVQGENSSEYGENYTYYDYTKKNAYTFTNLDPQTDYYYGVRSHYVSQFSPRKLTRAIGVAAPDATAATDINDRGSFTANWQPAPRATGYTVTCYGFTELANAENDYPILDEDFSNVDANVTAATTIDEAESLNNPQETALDAYTRTPGWTGYDNLVVQDMLGIDGNGYSSGILTTPQIDLSNAAECTVTVKAYGTAGDYLCVLVNGKNYVVTIPSDGILDGSFLLPVGGSKLKFKLFSYNYLPLFFDNIKVTQNLPKGARIYTWLDDAVTDSSTTSHTFTGLADFGFDKYAYDVISHYQYSDEQSVSSLTPSEAIIVDLANGTSTTGINELSSGVDSNKAVVRYTVDGRRVAAPVKGINILKFADGRTVKVIVK